MIARRNQPGVLRADPDDADVLAEVIAFAFEPLAVAHWLIPGEVDRRRTFPAYFRIFLVHGLRHGIVHTTEQRDAVAVWMPHEAPPIRDYPTQLQAACGRHAPQIMRFDQAITAPMPHQPHHHLAFLATRPGAQGTGLGTALLDHHHRWLDHHAVPAYLQASSPRTRDWYQRLAYHSHGDPIALDAGGPWMYPEWRDPRPAMMPPASCPTTPQDG